MRRRLDGALRALVVCSMLAACISIGAGAEGAGVNPVIYRVDGVPFKPYVEKLFTPSGTNILRDAPSDHLHHHGLMFAVRVNGINFWEEKPDSGKQEHVSVARDEGESNLLK